MTKVLRLQRDVDESGPCNLRSCHHVVRWHGGDQDLGDCVWSHPGGPSEAHRQIGCVVAVLRSGRRFNAEFRQGDFWKQTARLRDGRGVPDQVCKCFSGHAADCILPFRYVLAW